MAAVTCTTRSHRACFAGCSTPLPRGGSSIKTSVATCPLAKRCRKCKRHWADSLPHKNRRIQTKESSRREKQHEHGLFFGVGSWTAHGPLGCRAGAAYGNCGWRGLGTVRGPAVPTV